MRRWTSLTGLALMLTIAGGILTAAAQRNQSFESGRKQHIPGQFDYYQLVLSWSPTHCADNSRGPGDTQCGRIRKRPYAFVMHGLWPQYERGYPEYCRTRGRPFVPGSIITSMMDIMPSKGLIIHQYKKHGTCTGLSPAVYFKASRIAYRNVRIPKEYSAAKTDRFVSASELVRQFLTVNPTMRADHIQVVCKRGAGNRLKEIKVCMTRKGKFRACNKNTRRKTRHRCRSGKMHMPAARS